ncbi:MAG: hypothetical protein Q8T11_09520 [Elusimicrobiota bacterium]|nr:hypothetical protein [Elusimicrobiota bacterium]
MLLLLGAPAPAQVRTSLRTSAAPVPSFAASALISPAGLPSPVLALSVPALAPALAAPSVALPASVAVPASLRPVAAPASPERPNPLGQLRGVLTDWLKPDVSAEDASAAAPVTAYVLDLDGNAFGPGFPTKIILFRKGGDRELPVPTAHFAVIEKSIGEDFAYGGANLKDYELRGDASFREFFGPQFTADLKYAVENLPASQWQGPSWGALVRALGDPVLAAHTYVLTARQHTSEQLLDGFRYLQAAGYIRYLPKVENLHGVGGTHRTAQRKAELMAEFVDSLQAAPLGADGGRHAIGFSDDTWANHERMRDSLSAILRREPGRWSKVKIVLFFTGTNEVARRPEAIVLLPGGGTRPYVPGEPR